MYFIRNWRTEEKELEKIIQCTYARAQYNAGVSFSLFEQPDIKFPLLCGTVVNSIQNYLSSIDAKIHLDDPMIRLSLRTNDIFIMDVAISMQFTSNQLKRINAVREYFDLLYLSEVFEPNGTNSARGFYYGNASDEWYTRFKVGPKQYKPNSYSWKFWRRVLDTVVKPSSLKVRKLLGD